MKFYWNAFLILLFYIRCAFHFAGIFYFVEIFFKKEAIKSKNGWNIKTSHRAKKYMFKVAIETIGEGGKYVQSEE